MRTVLGIFVAIVLLPAFAGESTPKVPVPEAAKIKDAEKTIKDIFKDEYAKRGAEDKKALAAKLLQQGVETQDDAVSRYVLLKEAAANAVAGVDAETALKAADTLGQHYEIDVLALKVETLGKIVPGTADAAKAHVRQYQRAITEAVAVDNYDAAVRLCTAADAVARKTQDMPLVTQLAARGKEVRALQTEFAKVKAAQAQLTTAPDDPDACVVVGKFLCFTKGDWSNGLTLLVKGGDAALKAAAQSDSANPLDAPAQSAVADLWWDVAEKLPEPQKSNVRLRSGHWYRTALPGLAGLAKAKVEKRYEEVKKLSKALGQHIDLLKLLQLPKNVVDGTWKMDGEALVGSGKWSRVEFPYDVPEEYDLDVTYTQTAATDAGNTSSIQIMLDLAGSNVMFQQGYQNKVRMNWLKSASAPLPHEVALNKKYQFTAKVRRDGTDIWLDGKRLMQLKAAEYAGAAIDPGWRLRNPRWIGVGVYTVTVTFHEVTLIPK